jgi:hypothetical protein
MVASFQFANSALADSESELRLVGNALKIKVEGIRHRVNNISTTNLSTLNWLLDRCNKRIGADLEGKKKKKLQLDKAIRYSDLARDAVESEFQIMSKKTLLLRNTYINDCNIQNTRDKYEYCVVVAFQLDNVKLLQELTKDWKDYITQSSTISNSFLQCYETNPNVSYIDVKDMADIYEREYKFMKEFSSKIGDATDSLLSY